MFASIQNQFINAKSDEDGPISRKLNFLGCFQLDFARSNCGLQVTNDLAQIGDKINILVIDIVSETLICTADRRNTCRCFV